MKPVTINKLVVKNGSYEVLWETLILGDFHIGNVYGALAQTKMPDLYRESVTYILRTCGLPEDDKEYTYKKVAGTIIGTVIIRKKSGWVCENSN